MFDRIANREDPDQTASSLKQSDQGLHCFSWHFRRTTIVKNFSTFTVMHVALYNNDY